MAKTALIISGGAPNATLVGGALEAFHHLGIEFDVVSTAGAGALLGLMALAPKGGDPVAALQSLKELGIADLLYKLLPVNFKVFNKPGVLAGGYRDLTQPLNNWISQWPAHDPLSQAFKDSALLTLASVCPSDLNNESLGLCAHVPFAEEIIDFAKLKQPGPDIWINAYNLTQHKMQDWPRNQIDVRHLQAALSFPYLYPPTEIDGDYFIEGAAIDCLNFKSLCEHYTDLEEIVVFDLLGAERLLRKPRDLYDAWVMSIITPLVEIARDDIKLFKAHHASGKTLHQVPLLDAIPEADLPQVFDWSRSNLARLYDIGYDNAKKYAEQHLLHLKPGAAKPAKAAPAQAATPTATKPVTAKPVAVKTAAAKPVAAKTAASKPAAKKVASSTQAASAQAPASQPAASKTATTRRGARKSDENAPQ